MSQVEKFARTKLPKIFINNHVKKVVQEALWLCKFYPEADKEVVKTGAWLHDVTHLVGGYKGKDEHNIASSKTAKEFLTSINFDKNKLKKVIHCIKAHRTSTPPEPRTKEAKIVASADNLAHFVMADFLVKRMGLKRVVKKLRRDLRSKFMLPEASEKARRLTTNIEKRYKIKIYGEIK